MYKSMLELIETMDTTKLNMVEISNIIIRDWIPSAETKEEAMLYLHSLEANASAVMEAKCDGIEIIRSTRRLSIQLGGDQGVKAYDKMVELGIITDKE